MLFLFIGAVSTFLVFSFIHYAAKKKKPFKRAFLSMLFGLISLIAVNVAGMFFDIGLDISPFTITVSACGGVPAVAAMLLINTIFL